MAKAKNTIIVASNLPPGKVALAEAHPNHQHGEVFICDPTLSYEVEMTPMVREKLASDQLRRLSDKEVDDYPRAEKEAALTEAVPQDSVRVLADALTTALSRLIGPNAQPQQGTLHVANDGTIARAKPSAAESKANKGSAKPRDPGDEATGNEQLVADNAATHHVEPKGDPRDLPDNPFAPEPTTEPVKPPR